MNLRIALYQWIATHRLDARRGDALFELAGLAGEPEAVARRIWPVTAIVASALGGLGVILWIASNWGELGRMARFALLQSAVLVLCLGAVLRPRLRSPLVLLAFLCTGGVFAYFGQTYQTGADPWQLFAVWALLGLPLALGVRGDVLWAPWALVVSVGIALWVQAHTGHGWRAKPQDLPVYLVGWGAGLVLVTGLGPALQQWTGAGVWALRTAGTLCVVMVATSALVALFDRPVAPQYWLALLLLGVAAIAVAAGRFFEIFLLSALALALDTLLVAGLARLLTSGPIGDGIGILLVLGLSAAALLAGTVTLVNQLAQRHG